MKVNHRLGRCTILSFLVSLHRFRIFDPVFLKSDFVRGFSFPKRTLRTVTPRLSQLSWLYNSTISTNIGHCSTYCACVYTTQSG